ncbi:baseplate J/gp47 family protein [Pelistega sp. MC2]|uniref:baseplate assembly protein n=1 Tax=Pelistega sp. MC2 TaxID=1720297 RepID=UPI0008DA60CF|nr:baseplate J/gp47 family protein [Pelistega sp. MC2]
MEFNTFADIDLKRLPAPKIIESLNFERVYETRKLEFLAAVPESKRAQVEATLALESEPITILLQQSAYRELLLRQRVNDATHGVMLAFAIGSDLDQIGANKGVYRLVVTPADDTTTPPTPAVMEDDEAFRRRIQLSPEGYSCAGPYSAYLFYALSAHGHVKDISVMRPRPGDVAIYVLSNQGDGTTEQVVLDYVSAALNADDVRPLNDTVLVNAGEIVNYQITATLKFYPGVHKELSLSATRSAVEEYTRINHRLGRDITIAGIVHALKQEGVQDVTVTSPMSNLTISKQQAGFCTQITLNDGGTDE